MRGCLVMFVVLVLVLGGLLWFALPAAAAYLTVGVLRAGGVDCTDMTAEVTANPPFSLLVGHADTLHLTCTDLAVADFQATGADVTFGDVSLFSRQVQTVSGTFDTVVVGSVSSGPVQLQTVTIDGFASGADAEVSLTTSAAARLAEDRLAEATAIHGTVSFFAPDRVRIQALGQTIDGRLVVSGGALMLRPDAASFAVVPLIEPGVNEPFVFHAVAVAADGVHLRGTLDVASLIAGS